MTDAEKKKYGKQIFYLFKQMLSENIKIYHQRFYSGRSHESCRFIFKIYRKQIIVTIFNICFRNNKNLDKYRRLIDLYVPVSGGKCYFRCFIPAPVYNTVNNVKLFVEDNSVIEKITDMYIPMYELMTNNFGSHIKNKHYQVEQIIKQLKDNLAILKLESL